LLLAAKHAQGEQARSTGLTLKGLLQGRQQFLKLQVFKGREDVLDADDLPPGIFADVVACNGYTPSRADVCATHKQVLSVAFQIHSAEPALPHLIPVG